MTKCVSFFFSCFFAFCAFRIIHVQRSIFYRIGIAPMIGEHEYLSVDAPFVSSGYFGSSNLVYAQPIPEQIASSRNTLNPFGASRILHEKSQPRLYSSFGLQQSRNQLLNNQMGSYFPTSEGLAKYLSTPSAHLSTAGLAMSAIKPCEGYGPISTPTPFLDGADECFVPMSTMKKCMLGENGRRLPSVLKKALPLPPEDIRSVPHVRLNRVDSPPVVSVGMVDLDGIPTPWSRSPRPVSSKKEACDQIRESMRQDFDEIELFIQQAFTKEDNDYMS